MSVQFGLIRFLGFFWRFNHLRIVEQFLKTGTETNLLQRSFSGFELVLDVSRSVLHKLIYIQGERALPERFLFMSLLRPGMHVVDVGANIGYYLAFEQSGIGDKGWISCIEPSPENLQELKRNVAVNGWKNLDVYPCAVGASDCEIGLKGGINSGVVNYGDGQFQASMHPLDGLIDKRRCDFLKIDVDGYEFEVLKGAQKIIERDRPVVFLEYHPLLVHKYGGSFEQVINVLKLSYSTIEYFDVPDSMSLRKKIATNYFHADPVRRIEVQQIPESEMHIGRLYGTFWIVCRV